MICVKKPVHKSNGYLIIILFVVGLQRFVNAIEILGFTHTTFSPLKNRMIFAFYIIPIYYLFFKRRIIKKNSFKKEIFHFIVPTIFVAVDFFITKFKISYYWYVAFYFGYLGSIIVLVLKIFQLKKLNMLEKRNYETIRTWELIMASISFLLVIYSNYFLLSDDGTKINLNTFYAISSFLWLFALIYMFRNPTLIFGEQNLKNILSETQQDIFIWNEKPLKEIERKDELLFQSIVDSVGTTVMKIQKLQKNVSFISINTLNSKTISKELQLPKSHLDSQFKYYCYYSINEFGNLIKVNYALQLINEGYLNQHTLESLGYKCLFNSRFTFSKNFKKFIGVSISDYKRELDL